MNRTSNIARPFFGLLSSADALLLGRALPSTESQSLMRLIRRLFVIILFFGAAYGGVMGSFGFLTPHHSIQILYASLKVPLLLTVSFCVSLPSFLVLNTVLGVRADSRDVLSALVSMQAGLTVVLASLSPFTAFWYASFPDYDTALAFNGAMFAIATLSAQWILRRSYRPLIARNPRHRVLLRIWSVVYSFVAIQMAWVLRPFVGNPVGSITFFRREAWGNAYVEILHIVLRSVAL